jgi:hypothetical protein
MDDAVVVRLHAVVIGSRTSLNKPDARDLVKIVMPNMAQISGWPNKFIA